MIVWGCVYYYSICLSTIQASNLSSSHIDCKSDLSDHILHDARPSLDKSQKDMLSRHALTALTTPESSCQRKCFTVHATSRNGAQSLRRPLCAAAVAVRHTNVHWCHVNASASYDKYQKSSTACQCHIGLSRDVLLENQMHTVHCRRSAIQCTAWLHEALSCV